MMEVRAYRETDWPDVWRILEPVFRAGETYPTAREISEAASHVYWVESPGGTYVAQDGADLLGTYYIKPNQPALGAHVCNCGYVVAEAARGRGVATAMCEHSQHEAVTLGYRAMQYNLVVSTNAPSVHLWQKLGFATVGTLPGAFHHPEHGYVDAYIMYKQLVP